MSALKQVRRIELFLAAAALLGCAHTSTAPQKLTGIWHKVESGETASSISNRYAADTETIIELNDLPQNGSLSGRAEIFVPKESGKPPGTGAPPSAPLKKTGAKKTGQCGVGGRPCLEWPLRGEVSSGFGTRGGRQHDGIDIPAKRGTDISASEKGKVLYSGDDIKGYGNLIIIRHEHGIITVYAHNDENLVKEGDSVKRGQSIAKVGNTGSADGFHLHFEVRVDEQPKDPLLYLPPK